MILKSLVHWELSQGMTEEQLASAIGVPLRLSQSILHPVNWKYEDLPLTEPDFVWGKVVRLRKKL